jgi:hypothetical protein
MIPASRLTMAENSATICHTVFFRLKYPKDSAEERGFLAAAKKLASIPGVTHFACLKQVSEKNTFDFGLAMEFANQQLYDNYSNHSDHIAFIRQHWLPDVDNFMEIDYQVLPG